MDPATYLELRQHARRLCKRTADVDDLVQDTLVAGLRAQRDDLPWLMGTLRNLSAMQARTAARRRRREADVLTEADDGSANVDPAPPARNTHLPAEWQHWPISLRRLAVLALHGLGPEEIRYVLDLSEVAFRQRLSRLRKLIAAQPAHPAESLALAYQRDPARSVDLQFGLLRRALKAALLGRDGIATHDTDGHLLVIHRACHTSPPAGNG